MTKIQSVPQPVIAEVQGMATAAGCQLVATCDLAIASEAATFATPGVRIGLFCSTPMVAVSRALGRKRALEMLLTGDAIDALHRGRVGFGQSRGSANGIAGGHTGARGAHRPGQRFHLENRQASVLPPSRFAASRGLRFHARSDDRKRPGGRRPGRHLRVSRKARRRTGKAVDFRRSCSARFFRVPAPGSRSRACGTSEFFHSAWWGTNRQTGSTPGS